MSSDRVWYGFGFENGFYKTRPYPDPPLSNRTWVGTGLEKLNPTLPKKNGPGLYMSQTRHTAMFSFNDED